MQPKDQAANAATAPNPGNPANPGSVRTYYPDADGRILTVTESIAGATQTTSYSYDGMNNLTSVTQGPAGNTQNRTFGYDALGRLLSATNPESGTTTYTYDNNGNVITKTDARGVSTCFGPMSGSQCNAVTGYSSGAAYGYDGLNRVAGKQYSDGTPAVTYTYCNNCTTVNNGKGRLTSVAVSGGTTTQYNSYDADGRVLQHTQITNGTSYPFSYGYDAAGLPTSVGYPSGRTVTTNYDNAGRVGSVSRPLNGATANYAGPAAGQSYIQYTPSGALSQMNLGTDSPSSGLTIRACNRFRSRRLTPPPTPACSR